ncbi:cellulase family glycosylhydrolase [Flavimarina sp. Hel_I_48]|uniref:cellulase family glycosylhydrolase n=1 Tax=Flavimarina sp. Hel_I_48 TaxID=1392488 RepID=UPI00068FA61A|nr:cellulase family glycosylhydrolase [Flavimarina sp. Hel_I_48]
MRTFLILAFICFGIYQSNTVFAQKAAEKQDVFVDKKGVLRWGGTKKEVHGFGTNYTVPFAHAYRTAQKLNIDIKQAIDNDVYHFARLGFDLYRVHVWDTEISDSLGNLIENEHLELFDYLIKKLKERDINFVITPIAYWGNGWPEPDENTPGFTNKYGKENSLTDPGAIKAQENYLAQFLDHKNQYTGVAYKNEPNLIAFEVSNEPHHTGTPEEVTDFVQKMVTAMRSTGTKKPIFYNVSHSIALEEAYFNADIQGGTFQWYPTGLGFGKELEGNLVPNVNEYTIPFDDVIKKHNAAKIVYEFDSADVLKNYTYPIMARSFREAGIQLATQFAYDPTFMAFANTEYDTHYMNLAYTPQKALALAIASRIFHEIPMDSDYGTFPTNLEFGDFSISYDKNLSIYNTEEEFIYTNSNEFDLKSPRKLQHLAGFGDSKVVVYSGTGAYFLDKLENGLWRLEVLPDAIMLGNPFGSNSVEKKVAVIKWKTRQMQVKLPDLGQKFSINALNEGNDFNPEISGNSFEILPGTYLLQAENTNYDSDKKKMIGNLELHEFTAPKTNVNQTYVHHEPARMIHDTVNFEISATMVSKYKINRVEAYLQNGNMYKAIDLNNEKGYSYSAKVPAEVLRPGFLKYRIIVQTAEGTYTFPAGVKGSPGDWDFYAKDTYEIPVRDNLGAVYLFNAAQDSKNLVRGWQPENELVPTNVPGEAEYVFRIKKLVNEETLTKNGDSIYDYSFLYNFNKKVEKQQELLKGKEKLIIKAKSLSEKPEKLQVALLLKNGAAYGKTITLSEGKEEYTITLSDLKPVKTVTLPRPYPGFLPYYFEHTNSGNFVLEHAEALQFSIGPYLNEQEQQRQHDLSVRSVRLE